MTSATQEQRQNFRIKASEGENGAGVVIGNRFQEATAIDFSMTGAKLVLQKRVDVSEGDRIRVAIPLGQYVGLVRRLREASDGKQVIGVEFIYMVEDKATLRNSAFFGLTTGGRAVSGSFFPAIICAIIAALYGAFYFYNSMFVR